MYRTDLAAEARELFREKISKTEPDGVIYKKYAKDGCRIEKVDIINDHGAELMKKAVGGYVTVTPDGMFSRHDDAFENTVKTLADEISSFIDLSPKAPVMVAALGNRAITPDSIGACTADNLLVTRHLVKRMPQYFENFRPVSVIVPGVMGTTGIETADYVNSVAAGLHPSLIIAVDALASRRMARLCRTVQITDTGIAPGSGTGGDSPEISRKTMGVPVVAVGVPTIVDSMTLTRDVLEDAGMKVDDELLKKNSGAMVTTREIDEQVKRMGALIGYAIDLALHPGLSFSELETFLA